MQRRVRRFALGCSLALTGAWLGWSASPAQATDGEDATIALARDLELIVAETGPEQPWTIHLHNRGSAPIAIMADPGLLWFEVAVPGVPAPRVCRLPEPLWPTAMRRRAELVLQPGERFSRRFDPRFFCFSDVVQTTLVPGAKVTPHFGWPQEQRATTVKGKAQSETLRPRAPFVAWLKTTPESPAAAAGENGASAAPDAPLEEQSEGAERGAEAASSATPWQPPAEGLKNLTGGSLTLAPPYAKWSERTPTPTPTINVALLAGSDAEDERNAVVTVGVGNGAAVPQSVFVRRDLMSFDVVGPDGPFECQTNDLGTPDVASFTTFQPRAAEQLVVRLIEMCPRNSFSRPGVYEVQATLHAKFSGQASGVDAFVGDVASTRPVLVRVRSGERPSFSSVAPMVAGAGGPGDAPAGAPTTEGDGHVIEGPEAPAEEAPAEANPALDDGPPPQEAPAPPDGTSVE